MVTSCPSSKLPSNSILAGEKSGSSGGGLTSIVNALSSLLLFWSSGSILTNRASRSLSPSSAVHSPLIVTSSSTAISVPSSVANLSLSSYHLSSKSVASSVP